MEHRTQAVPKKGPTEEGGSSHEEVAGGSRGGGDADPVDGDVYDDGAGGHGQQDAGPSADDGRPGRGDHGGQGWHAVRGYH